MTEDELNGEKSERWRIVALLRTQARVIREAGKVEQFMHPRLRGDTELKAKTLENACDDIEMTARDGRFGV
jgi:hypothetical protein